MQMLAAYVAARRVRRARAIKKAQFMMRLVTYQFSALVLKSFAMRRHRIETRVRHKFTRAELPAPDKSSWKYVVSAGLDSGYLEMTALTVGSFRKLHDEFAPRMTAHWDSNRVNEGGPRVSQRGRPRLCSTWDALGLVLCYFHQMDLQGSLGQKFGFTPSATNRYLNAGREVLLQTLRHMPDATIKWPRRHEMERHARRISRAQPHLTGCFGFVDGLNIAIENPADPIEQNAYYNGWLSGCYCSNIFVFDSEGCIIWCCLNNPGSWNDSAISMELYELLRTKVPEGFGICADSAFAASGDLATKVFKPLTESQIAGHAKNPGITVWSLVSFLRKHRAAVSVRQAAEWGMGALQRTFRRLHTTLTAEHEHRRMDLAIVARLFNYRTRTTHINQIRTVYDENYIGRDPDSKLRWSLMHEKRNPTF